jgi:hypothetical protein
MRKLAMVIFFLACGLSLHVRNAHSITITPPPVDGKYVIDLGDIGLGSGSPWVRTTITWVNGPGENYSAGNGAIFYDGFGYGLDLEISCRESTSTCLYITHYGAGFGGPTGFTPSLGAFTFLTLLILTDSDRKQGLVYPVYIFANVVPTPLPGTLALLTTGIAILGLALNRRRKRLALPRLG